MLVQAIRYRLPASTVWLRLSHRMPRQTPSDDSLANRNSAGRSFCSTILLSFSGRSYVAFREGFFFWSVCELNIICPFRFLLKFLLSNCYVIAMSCDLLLCPCYVIALRMLCFCFALIIYCKLQVWYRPYIIWGQNEDIFLKCIRKSRAKGNSLLTLMRFYEPLK